MVISPVDLGFPYNLLNIPTNPHNMVIFPVGFPYNLQRAKFPYFRGIPLRVATLVSTHITPSDWLNYGNQPEIQLYVFMQFKHAESVRINLHKTGIEHLLLQWNDIQERLA